MAIPKNVKIKNNLLPAEPGVYLMRDAGGEIIYVGKAASLKSRVSSYFLKSHDDKTARLVRDIRRIDYQITLSVLEALILEANLIKKYLPKYNIREKDDKSFLYLAITKDDFPRPMLIRGLELRRMNRNRFKAVFGPYLSARSLRAALDLIRKMIPYSTCEPNQKRACFNFQIGKCPGVCAGKISRADYAKIIRNLILFFQGRKTRVLANLKKEMKRLSENSKFEKAATVRNQIRALEHIQDIALLKRDEPTPEIGLAGEKFINIFGRVEGYDISMISGQHAVGSMVVFDQGEPAKGEYRKFKIKTIRGTNDTGMLKEVLARRFRNRWPHPDLILIDGGRGQVNAALEILSLFRLRIPAVGIAKGITRKKDELIYDRLDPELKRVSEQYKAILVRVRDEAHRFAVKYHREIRGRIL
ncbi:MAG: excinuclease ABC subunit UvrC [Patescibacteria group bacterium]|nr:excinuclease ABC subunit UvrC [Patescibacteria group bacterium]